MSSRPDRPIFASVIVPCYKTADTVKQTIDSVLQQNANVEIIVINDGSPDNTREVVQAYGDQVVYLEQKNSGLPSARNAAIAHAKGEFLHFLDSDDIVLPGFYEAFEQSYRKNEAVDYLSGNWIFADENCVPINNIPCEPVTENAAVEIFTKNRFGILGVMVRRTSVLEVGGFDKTLPASADWELWIRLARHGVRFRHLDNYLCLYRNRPGSNSKNFFYMWRALRMIQDKHGVLVANHPKRKAILRGQIMLLLDRDLRFFYGDDANKPWVVRRYNRTKKFIQMIVSAPGLVPFMAGRMLSNLRGRIGGMFVSTTIALTILL